MVFIVEVVRGKWFGSRKLNEWKEERLGRIWLAEMESEC